MTVLRRYAIEGLRQPLEDGRVIVTRVAGSVEFPARFALVGGGYIAAEFSHLAARAGAHVTVLQRAERMLPAFDPDLVGWLMEKFGELGIDVRTRSTVQRIEKVANGFLVHASTDGQMQTVTADLVVHAAGRAPDLDTLDRPCARLLAAAGLATTLAAIKKYPLTLPTALDLSPTMHWPDPVLAWQPGLDEGPVLVTVEYSVEPPQAEGFLNAMRELERRRRRDGAIQWALFHDVAQPSRYVETFIVESWAEELRRHEHVTAEDRAAEERVLSFQSKRTPPIVTHLVAEHLVRESSHKRSARTAGMS